MFIINLLYLLCNLFTLKLLRIKFSKIMDEIKIGDVVELKSSASPKMTVNSLEGFIATCVWFVAGDIKQAQFHVQALRKVR